MPDGPIIPVAAIRGSSPSDDGLTIAIGFTLPNGEAFNVTMAHERAIDLIMHAALAAGHAARNRTQDPSTVYAFPAADYEVGTPTPDGMVLLHLGLPDGPKLSFRFDLAGALRLHEGLGSALGVSAPSIPPGTRPN